MLSILTHVSCATGSCTTKPAGATQYQPKLTMHSLWLSICFSFLFLHFFSSIFFRTQTAHSDDIYQLMKKIWYQIKSEKFTSLIKINQIKYQITLMKVMIKDLTTHYHKSLYIIVIITLYLTTYSQNGSPNTKWGRLACWQETIYS